MTRVPAEQCLQWLLRLTDQQAGLKSFPDAAGCVSARPAGGLPNPHGSFQLVTYHQPSVQQLLSSNTLDSATSVSCVLQRSGGNTLQPCSAGEQKQGFAGVLVRHSDAGWASMPARS